MTDPTEDEALAEATARELVKRHGPASVDIVLQRLEAARALGNERSTRTWQDILDHIRKHLPLAR
jgi:hypothetical protein